MLGWFQKRPKEIHDLLENIEVARRAIPQDLAREAGPLIDKLAKSIKQWKSQQISHYAQQIQAGERAEAFIYNYLVHASADQVQSGNFDLYEGVLMSEGRQYLAIFEHAITACIASGIYTKKWADEHLRAAVYKGLQGFESYGGADKENDDENASGIAAAHVGSSEADYFAALDRWILSNGRQGNVDWHDQLKTVEACDEDFLYESTAVMQAGYAARRPIQEVAMLLIEGTQSYVCGDGDCHSFIRQQASKLLEDTKLPLRREHTARSAVAVFDAPIGRAFNAGMSDRPRAEVEAGWTQDVKAQKEFEGIYQDVAMELCVIGYKLGIDVSLGVRTPADAEDELERRSREEMLSAFDREQAMVRLEAGRLLREYEASNVMGDASDAGADSEPEVSVEERAYSGKVDGAIRDLCASKQLEYWQQLLVIRSIDPDFATVEQQARQAAHALVRAGETSYESGVIIAAHILESVHMRKEGRDRAYAYMHSITRGLQKQLREVFLGQRRARRLDMLVYVVSAVSAAFEDALLGAVSAAREGKPASAVANLVAMVVEKEQYLGGIYQQTAIECCELAHKLGTESRVGRISHQQAVEDAVELQLRAFYVACGNALKS